MLHLLFGIVALIWTLIGLWVLRRMWAISAAERRERKLERREQRAERREEMLRNRAAVEADIMRRADEATARRRANPGPAIAGRLMLAVAMWGGALYALCVL